MSAAQDLSGSWNNPDEYDMIRITELLQTQKPERTGSDMPCFCAHSPLSVSAVSAEPAWEGYPESAQAVGELSIRHGPPHRVPGQQSGRKQAENSPGTACPVSASVYRNAP